MSRETKFSLRSFTSFLLVFSTLVMSWSGFILYVAPAGRIANWDNWQLMLFTKPEWQALHTIFSYLFFILAIIHLFFVNWKTFLTYIKSKIRSGINKKWELVSATFLSVVIFTGTLYSWTPFGPVMSFGEKLKGSWETRYKTPPVAHMEEYNLVKLSEGFDNSTPEGIMKILTDNNIRVRTVDATLKTIAGDNNKTPSELYNLITSGLEKNYKPAAGEVPAGTGKMTLLSVSQGTGIPVGVLADILKEKGIEAGAETTLRSVAEELGITPKDVYLLLTEK